MTEKILVIFFVLMTLGWLYSLIFLGGTIFNTGFYFAVITILALIKIYKDDHKR